MPTLVASNDNKVRGLRVMEYRDCHHHTTFDRVVAGNCVDPLGRRKMEDVDLKGISYLNRRSWRGKHTVSELMVFGTAIRSSYSVSDSESEEALISVWAKEQKFMVFT